MAQGALPWFADPNMSVRFFRPLSSLLFALDMKLFRDAPALAHAHSLLWFFAALAAVKLLLCRALPGAVGALALLIFAIDEAHWSPIGWLANRHALVAVVPVLFGLVAHLRWREEGWRPGLPLSLGGFTLGLLGGETALQVLAYLAAYELVGAPRRRLAGLAPATLLVLIYLGFYQALGFGAHSAEHYINPLDAPKEFLTAALTRVPTLVADAFGGLSSDLAVAHPALKTVAPLVGAFVIAAVAWLLAVVWRHLAEPEARAARWLALGAGLSFLPAAAGPVGSRLLLAPTVGTAAIVAILLFRLPSVAAGSARRFARVGRIWLLVVHLVAAPLSLPLALFSLGRIADRVEALATGIRQEIRSGKLPAREIDVIVVNVPDLAAGLYPYFVLLRDPQTTVHSWRGLSASTRDHLLTRTGPRSFTLEVQGGPFFSTEPESLFRSSRDPLPPGRRVHLPGLDIEVLSPRAIDVKSDRALEDPTLLVLGWLDGSIRRLPVPRIGESLTLPWTPGPMSL